MGEGGGVGGGGFGGGSLRNPLVACRRKTWSRFGGVTICNMRLVTVHSKHGDCSGGADPMLEQQVSKTSREGPLKDRFSQNIRTGLQWAQ